MGEHPQILVALRIWKLLQESLQVTECTSGLIKVGHYDYDLTYSKIDELTSTSRCI